MSFASSPLPPEIFLVEDDPADVRLTREALKHANVACRLTVACDGEEASRLLREVGLRGDNRRPDLILMDLNLPKKSGIELLGEVKSNPSLRRIPVVVLSNSNSVQDAHNSYDLHANCYLNKPADMCKFVTIIESIKEFWLSRKTL